MDFSTVIRYADRMRTRLVLLLSMLSPTFLSVSGQEDTLWKDTVQDIEKALTLEEELPTLPRSKWFARDQIRAKRDLREILDEVLEVLEVSGLTEKRDAYQKLGFRIQDREREIRTLRERSLSAPADVSAVEFYRKTRQDYLEAIDAAKKDIEALEEQRDDLRAELVAEFQKSGLEVNEEQIGVYLGTVSGQDMITLSAIFSNIRDLNVQLERLMKQSPGDAEAARRYYGMHMVLLRALLQAHDMTLDRLDTRYLIRLDSLEEENRELMKETKKLLRYASPEERPMLTTNLHTQQTTAEAITLYRNHLRSVRDNVYEGKKRLDRRHEIALNTFMTIRISSQLIREMESAIQDLGTLRSMQLPELVPIQDEAIREKFLDLGNRLQSE